MIAKMMTLTELIVNAQAAYRSMDNPQISEAEFIADFIQSYYPERSLMLWKDDFSFSRDWEAVCKALQLPTDTQEAELKVRVIVSKPYMTKGKRDSTK